MFEVSVQVPAFKDTYDRMLFGDSSTGQKGVPNGTFYLKGAVTVPFTPSQTTFVLQTDSPGVGVNVIIYQLGQSAGVDQIVSKVEFSFVPGLFSNLFQANLGKGRNLVQVKETTPGGRSATVIVVATHYSTFLQAYSREIFGHTQITIDDQRNAIFNDYSTRLVDNLLDFQDLLPEVQALQIISNKFAIRSLVHQPGSQIGTQDFITALTQSTPIFEQTRNQFEFEPIVRTLFNNAEDFSGVDAHVWIPNLGITRWLAFVKLVSNISQVFKIIKVTEDEVDILFNGEFVRHQFQTDILGVSSLDYNAQRECFKNITVIITFLSQFYMKICAASYTFDWVVEECAPVGDERLFFDSGCATLDSYPMDADFVDPYTDGWVGHVLTGRLENEPHYQALLDSHVQPSSAYVGGDCSYPFGFYTQNLNNSWCETEIPVMFALDGEVLP